MKKHSSSIFIILNLLVAGFIIAQSPTPPNTTSPQSTPPTAPSSITPPLPAEAPFIDCADAQAQKIAALKAADEIAKKIEAAKKKADQDITALKSSISSYEWDRLQIYILARQGYEGLIYELPLKKTVMYNGVEIDVAPTLAKLEVQIQECKNKIVAVQNKLTGDIKALQDQWNAQMAIWGMAFNYISAHCPESFLSQ